MLGAILSDALTVDGRQEMRTELDRQQGITEGLHHQLETLRRRDHDLMQQVPSLPTRHATATRRLPLDFCGFPDTSARWQAMQG